jgi:hypothetical protein
MENPRLRTDDSLEFIHSVTETVMDEGTAWQARPLHTTPAFLAERSQTGSETKPFQSPETPVSPAAG